MTPANIPAKLRSSGIVSVGDVPWGTHFCHFYETREDLLDILIPYFKAGLENNELCMWIVCDPVAEADGHRALRNAVPEFDRRLAAGDIEIVLHSQWCFREGIFDGQRVIAGWKEKLARAQALRDERFWIALYLFQMRFFQGRMGLVRAAWHGVWLNAALLA